MPDFYFKTDTPKKRDLPVEQKQTALQKGLKKWEAIEAEGVGKGKTFESDAQKREYLNLVNANPHNVPGLPTFFPATQLKSFVTFREMTEEEKRKKAEQDRILASVVDSEQYCRFCDKITPHQEWEGMDRFCKKCGHIHTSPA